MASNNIIITDEIIQRFWRKVDRPSDDPDVCWEWKRAGTRGNKDYGFISLHGRRTRAHRLAWMIEYGPIPAGRLICHSCDNKPCVRIDHLWLGTPKHNALDALLKGRWPKGEKAYNSKLTDKQRAELFEQVYAGASIIALAKKYNIHKTTIYKRVYDHNPSRLHPKRYFTNIKKIPESERPRIIERRTIGKETFVAIAKDYGVSDRAICYIVNRDKKRKLRAKRYREQVRAAKRKAQTI